MRTSLVPFINENPVLVRKKDEKAENQNRKYIERKKNRKRKRKNKENGRKKSNYGKTEREKENKVVQHRV